MSFDGSSTSAGITPVTWYGSPFSRMSRPTIARSPPKCDAHVLYVSTTNLSAPGLASSSTNARPRNGRRPSVEKNDGVTARPRTCSGCPCPWAAARFKLRIVNSVASSIAGACVFLSR